MASEVLLTISKDEVERARLMSEYKGEVDYQSKMVYAKRMGMQQGREEGRKQGREEGHKQGREEGREQGRVERALEIAGKMRNAGKPLSEIAEFTGLTVEAIERV